MVAILACINAHSRAELDIIKDAIVAKQWARAGAGVLRLQGVPGVDQTEVRFHEGMLAMSRNQFDAAANTFRGILEARPDLLRVRLELARALYLAGKDDAAGREFDTVLAADLPAAVAENVRTFLSRIRARRTRRIDASFGYVAKGNATGAAGEERATINGVSYRMSDDARRPSGSGVDLRASGRYRVALSEKTRFTVWSEFSRKNSADSGLDDTTVKVGGDTVWSSRGSELSLSPFYTYRTYQSSPYLKNHGVRLEARRKFAARWLITGLSEWSYQRFANTPGRNGPLCRVSARAHAVVSKSASAYGEMSYRREQGASPLHDSSTWSAIIGASRNSDSGVGASAEFGVRRQRYLQTQPVYDRTRADRETVAKLQMINHGWKVFGTTPAIVVSRIRNHSTIDSYSSDRTLVNFVSQKRF